jgi:FKBP-type peptidyl-prolyl cis-trans isomerase FkpA
MTVSRKFLWLVPALSLFVAACGGGGDDGPPTSPTPPPPAGPATLQVTELTVGTGTEATPGMFVNTHYTLWRYDPAGTDSKGEGLDTSRDGDPPYSFTLGNPAGGILGYQQIVNGMRVGGSRRGIVPPSLAYGSGGSGPIRPNEWLVFEIELLAVTQ